MVSIQFSYMSPSMCKCSSPSRNLVSWSLLTLCLCTLNCLSCGDVLCGTFVLCLVAYSNVGTTYGATLPFIIFCACAFVLLCSFLVHDHEAPPSSTLFFHLRAFLVDFVAIFLIFSSVICIYFLVLLTLACGFCGLPNS